MFSIKTNISLAVRLTHLLKRQLRKEYETSINELVQSKHKLAATDRLIDQLVYRLYNLTPEEIAVVQNTK